MPASFTSMDSESQNRAKGNPLRFNALGNRSNSFAIRSLFKKFLDWMRRWLERHADWPAYVWVLERGKKYGLHTHMLLHVPTDLGPRFKSAATERLSEILGSPLLDTPESKTMLIQTRGPDVNTQWRRFRYLVKGIDPRLGWMLDAEHGGFKTVAERAAINPKDAGTIQGKRVGVSRELDYGAFKRWAAVNDLPEMRIEPWGDWLYGNRFLNWYIANQEMLIDPGQPRNGTAGQETEMGGFP